MSQIDEGQMLLELPQELLNKRKTAIEIVKINAEIKKINRENELIKKHPLTLPNAYVPLLVALIALAGVVVKWRLDILTATTHDIEQSSQVSGLEAALAKAAPATPTSTVNIRFRGALKRELVTNIQQALNADGFIAPPPVRTADVQSTIITYYSSDDRASAEKIANKTTEIFQASDCVVVPTTKFIATTKPERQAIDLDIYTACK